ncbi:MAG TPA: nitrile hydratase subunit beta [Candidatus Binataceae bacterium]|nr:nitrile hydratase subunit beta [Candidatus Binataceae bacterium]
MNSVHDIGGMDGFGPVEAEANEPVFREPWEGRTWGMLFTSMPMIALPLDALRHRIERQHPVDYLAASYYQRHLNNLENLLIETGILSSEEIESRVTRLTMTPSQPVPRLEDPAVAAGIAEMLKAGSPVTRSISKKPRFAVGDKIVTRNLNPHGHTRMPRYTRGKKGVITAHHGAHVFPDTNAHGLGENPQHLYTVRIGSQELWGPAAASNECVLIDLWESYLAPDASATKAALPVKPKSSRKVAKAKAVKAKAVKATRPTPKVSKGKPARTKVAKLKRVAQPKVAARVSKPVRGKAKTTRKKSR